MTTPAEIAKADDFEQRATAWHAAAVACLGDLLQSTAALAGRTAV